MAVLWSKQSRDTLYEVRSAGATRRLYTNGVLHSAYNPGHAFTGSIWDLLFLPALFYPPQRIRRVLILGAGAGAVIHLLNRYLKPKSITALDNDETHLYAARRFFGVDYANTRLVHADAIDWVERYRGPAFDMVIEDLFFDLNGEPVRLMHNDTGWFSRLHRLTARRGMLVINHGDAREARFSLAHAGQWAGVYRFSVPVLENRVLAFLGSPAGKGTLKAGIERAGLDKAPGLRYRCQAVDRHAMSA